MQNKPRGPWTWVPSLYYAEGIPYIVVMSLSVIMYKRLGISNTDIALYTSWLYLPWVIKPVWSPFVDIIKTKRWWIIIMQLFIGAGFAGVAFTIPMNNFFQYSLAFLWLLAFSSATHDIAADGFYMLGLSQHQQAWFVGIRSTFYRLAMITGQGLLIILAGFVESNTGLENVSIPIVTDNAQEQTFISYPDSLSYDNFNEKFIDENLKIIYYPKNLVIHPIKKNEAEIDSIILFANSWNEINSHVKTDSANAAEEKKDDEGFFSRLIKPLEAFLKEWFGPDLKNPDIDYAGNISLVYFTLSNLPEDTQEIVINLGRDSGDKSISLISGNRLIFTKGNWNIPAIAVIQLDPKLDENTSAIFIAHSGNIPLAWSLTFLLLAVMLIFFSFYHKFMLPKPDVDITKTSNGNILQEFGRVFILFINKKHILSALSFLLLFRFAEAQIVKLASPFLLDSQEVGGLALTTGEVGLVYGTIGLISLTFGGILGGFVAAKQGLKYWIWPMAIAINLPDVVYVFLSYTQTDSMFLVYIAVAIEQFGYGFGFTAYMLFMIYISDGEHKTAHFAIATAFMALGMMLPGMVSGWLQEILGYQNFFIWVMIATIPAILVVKFVKIDPQFGKKEAS